MPPPGGRVLDAACSTGKYLPLVLAGGRSLVSAVTPTRTWQGGSEVPDVPTEEHDLQDLGCRFHDCGRGRGQVARLTSTPINTC
jgi:hypothetical protein